MKYIFLEWIVKTLDGGYMDIVWYEKLTVFDIVWEEPRFIELIKEVKERIAHMREEVLAEEL